MKVDREQQREILNLLFEHYPWKTNAVISKIKHLLETEEERTVGNLLYLQSHGLIEKYIEVKDTDILELCSNVDRDLGDPIGTNRPYTRVGACPTISAKGIDFLLGDEGLSSILNTQTVKLDLQSTNLLIDYFIERSDISEEEQNSIKQKLKSVPLSVMQELLTKLLVEKTPYQEVLNALMNML